MNNFRQQLLDFPLPDAYRNAAGFYERNDFARMLTKETEDPQAPTIPLFFDFKRLTGQAA